MTWDMHYKREEHAPSLTPGDYRVEIVAAEERISQSGNPMIIVSIKPNGSNTVIKYYLVQGQYFNRNATQIFDSFNIDEGDFDLVGWVGAVGAAKLGPDKNNSRYLKVDWFIHVDRAGHLPPWVGPKPERQRVVNGSTFLQVSDDEEIPF